MTEARQRVLYIAPVEPWCRENGSSLITADLLEALSRLDDVELLPIFLRRPPEGYVAARPPRMAGKQIGLEGLPKWMSIAKAIATGSSPMHQRFDNAKAADAVLDAVGRDFVPDVVHVEHLPLVDIGRRIADRYGVPLVYRAHNIESELWARRLGLPGAAGRLVTRRLGALEARAMMECDLTLCISSVDLEWAKRRAPKAPVDLLPCSLDLSRYEQMARNADRSRPRIGFVGGLDWAPNEAGLHWFVHQVLPHVLREMPEARLAVLARGAATRDWLTSNPAVDILPAEGDARELFASSRVSIAPLLQGGGVRIKIPESLALGCPVVATPIGGEGLDLPGLTTTTDPASFGQACVRHLREVDSAGLGERLRAAVEARHGAGVVAADLVGFWRSAARPGGADRPSATAA